MKQTLLTLFFILCSLALNAQGLQVKGVVTSADDGQPIPGVSISVKGTTTGLLTDVNGAFTLNVPAKSTLVFSFVGMKTQEILVTASTTLNVVLQSEIATMDEVIVVGYGVQKKSLVTGAISSIKADDIINLSITRPEQALQGKTAGVQVISAGGSPGAGMKVRIRGVSTNGSSNPLYVVDGVKSGDINYLDPNDIQSMEVLKDAASSAIYGAEGANGVVMITTKTGRAGISVLNYEIQTGWLSVAKKPTVMATPAYVKYQNEAGRADISTVNNNWLDDIFETGFMQKHHLSYSGGNDKSTFSISGSYLSQDGIITGSRDKFNRYSVRLNSDHKVSKWLKVGENMAFTHSLRKGVAEDNEYGGVIGSALQLDPTTPVRYTDPSQIPADVQAIITAHPTVARDANGNIYGISTYANGEINNPFVIMEYGGGANGPGVIQDKILGDVFAEISPIKGLTFTSRLGIDLAYQINHRWNKIYYYNDLRYNDAASVNENIDNWYTWQWDNFATYTKKIGDHDFTVMAGMSSQEYKHRATGLYASPMAVGQENYSEFDYVTSETADNVSGYTSDDRLVGYFGRISYSYKEKYLLQGNIRRDGASLSKLPKVGRWGLFPSFSAGWIASNEDFFPKSFLTYAKLRASWGKNGSLSNLGSYSYVGFITSSGLQYPLADGTIGIPSEPNSLNNPELTWETSVQTDIGIDLRAWRDKLSFTVDYYNKKTTDLLTPNTPPYEAGNTASFINAGDVVNKGLEFELGLKNNIGELQYSVNLNLATNNNEVTYLNPSLARLLGPNVGPGWNATATEVGYPIWYFRGYKTNGIDPATGDAIFVDVNGDGLITSDDQTMIGNPHPKVIYGGNVNLSFKGFDFSLFLQGMSGNDAILGWIRNDRAYCNKPTVLTDNHWSPTNTTGTMPGANASALSWNSDLLVFDASYLRVQQIQLGYSLPTTLLKSIKIKGIRLYISLDDYFTFTKYPGFDPDAGTGNDAGIGIDRGVYPASRKTMFGASISF
jgi:TonB-linked outer membrane protein, SusC/RagA family/TonB-dependent outer membrane receptor, SusC/RagA subfamily, signature region